MKRLWYYILGWRKGLPKENGTYLFQFSNGMHSVEYYVKGSKHLKHAIYYKAYNRPYP